MTPIWSRKLTIAVFALLVAIVMPVLPAHADAGSALEFDGTNDVVSLGTTASVLGTGWEGTKTIILWLKPGVAPPPVGDIVGEYIVGTDRPRIFGINRADAGTGDRLRIWNNDGSNDTVVMSFEPGEWMHVAVVHAGGTLTVYRDGVLVGSIPSGPTYAPSSGSLWVGGGDRSAASRFFAGEIDELQYWGTALDQETIQAWMFRELDATHPHWADLRAYYSMSDGAGTALSDDSGHGVTGTLLGGMTDANWVASGAFDGAPDTIAPEATAQALSTAEDVAVGVVLAGMDADGDPLTFRVVDAPDFGVLSGTEPNLTYTPNTDYNGTDTFTFVANDGLLDSAEATVAITVTPANDPPVAADDSATTQQDVAVTIDVLSNDVDVDGDALTITTVGTASSGSVANNGNTVTYTPAAGFVGMDSFTYTVDDGHGANSSATVSVDVQRVNNQPHATAQALSTAEDVAVGVVLAGTDADGDPLTFRVVDAPDFGVLSGTEPNLTYTPNTDYNGTDTFTFVANDGLLDSAEATVAITVTPANDPPVAADDSATTQQDVAVTIDVLSNDVDVDGDALTITSVGTASSGSVANNGNTVTYTPAVGFVGMDSFTYTVDDGHGVVDTATVSVNVIAASAAGSALRFDGVNDYVQMPNTLYIFGAGWQDSKSVTLWVKPTGLASVPQYPTPAWCDAVVGDRPRWWGISRCELQGYDRLWVWNFDGNLDAVGVEYNRNEWLQIGLVHDGGHLTAYRNGVAVGSVPSGTTVQPNTGALPVFQYGAVVINARRNLSFEGEIDELRLWSVARTSGEIYADLLHPLSGNETGLAAYHQMSEGQGDVVSDASGHSQDGTLMDGLPPQVPPDGPITWVDSGAFHLPETTVTSDGDSVILQIDDVSLVDLAELTAETVGGQTVVSWLTYSEFFNLGFNIYRSRAADGPYELITPELIPSTGSDQEAFYRFADNPGAGTFFYKLEDVNDQGVTHLYGPVEVTVGRGNSETRPLYLPALKR